MQLLNFVRICDSFVELRKGYRVEISQEQLIMASNQEATIPLRYWVDNEQKRVVMAEASGDFVDVLFSFLTLPLGTIIRLGNQFQQPVQIGCINNLYESVQNLRPDVFWNNICQKMLLAPRNPLEASYQRLKVKVDGTEPTKYFMCHSCSKGSDLLLSSFDGAWCSCRKLMRKKMELLEESKDEASGVDGVFVKGDAMFLIFDDLTVLRSSPSDSLQTPLLFGHADFSNMQEMSQDVGPREIFSILKHALTSKSPLSDVFIPNRKKIEPSYSFSPDTGPSHWKGSVEIKLMVSKSKNKVLFAEADGDFVDFLVSFLTTPLGSILNLMNGKSSLGSIDNLYASVKKLNASWFIGSSNKSLLNPRVAPQFGCGSNPLNASQEYTPTYWYGTVVVKDNNEGRTMISKKKEMLQYPAKLKLFEPRCYDGAREAAVGFMKRPCLFVVSDDLKVRQLTTTSSIQYMQELGNVKFDDLKEHMVEIRKSHEALNLLRTSLTSKEVGLTRSLLKKWKCQRCIPFWDSILGCVGMEENET
ncbi:uncharacterized protein LOC114418385 isoform X1 [Glycine soja]|nr:uncharacterized protein LOC114418385 isoform X1 [Glycine soja]